MWDEILKIDKEQDNLSKKYSNELSILVNELFSDVFIILREIGFYTYYYNDYYYQFDEYVDDYNTLKYEFIMERRLDYIYIKISHYKKPWQFEPFQIKNKKDSLELIKFINTSYSKYKPYGRKLKIKILLK